MSSQPSVAPEAQIPASSTKLQTTESSITGAAQGSPVSTSTCSLMSSAGGSGNTVADPVAASQNINSGPADSVTLSAPTSSPSQRAFHGTASDSLQDPVRAKLVTSHGYVVPPPSFSYSVFPRVNSASGIPQQTSSPVQALKLTQQVSPASLQPPVPGQSFVNRPSFSYNIIQPPNSSPAAGQQFQPSTVNNQRPLSIGNPALPPPASPLLIATCLQPPVPRQAIFPNATISGTMPHNLPQNLPPPPMKLPVPPPKGQLSPSTNFSFGGGSRPTILEASVKSLPINTGTSDAVSLDTSISSVSTSLNSKASHDRHASSTAVAGTTASSNMLKTPIPAAVQPTNPGSSSATVRSIQHNQVLAPPSQSSFANSIPLNVPQQMYPRFPSVPAQNPQTQAHWLNPPLQATGLHCHSLSQYPPTLPGPSPFPMSSMTPSSDPSPEVRPSGVSLNVNCEQVSTSIPESFSVSNTEAGSPTPEAVIEKKINDLLENNNIKSEEMDAWTVHKTETGVLHYCNTISGESTYERPSRFKGEVSSWQVPAEVLEMRKNHAANSSREENSCIPADKGTVDSSNNAPALQTGGRDSTTLRTPGGQVSASALDLIKKKLQDSATPTVSAPLQTLVSPASNFSGSKTVDSSAKGQQPVTSKERVKDANGDENLSDSSSDSDDEENRPTKEERIIQFKEKLKETWCGSIL